MKKILLALVIVVTSLVASAQSTSPRFGTTVHDDPTFQNLTNSQATVTLAATDSISPNAFNSYYKASVAGAKTLHIRGVNAHLWDRCFIQITADGTNRLITLTGSAMQSVASTDTITAFANKQIFVGYYFNGTKWVQMTRIQQK